MNIFNFRASLLLLMAMFVMALRVDGVGICHNPWIDAMVQMPSGLIYAFRGNEAYLLNGSTLFVPPIAVIADGYPKPITTEFPGVPNGIDAAVVYRNSVYFFKDWYFYEWNGIQLVRVGKIHEEFQHVPDKLDAAFEHENDIVFLKESSYYKYLGETVIHGSIWNWDWPLVHPDAAFYFIAPSVDILLYVFEGIHYYELDIDTKEVLPGFPRETGPDWFGC